MRFYSVEQCEAWLTSRQWRRPDELRDMKVERVNYPPEPYRLYYVARWMATELPERTPVLLWITEWGIWPSSENWHLYYKLRHSYGDNRLLDEAPGHLFLEHEAEDMASFLQLAMLNGWGGYLLTHANSVNAFFSHDEYIDFFAQRESDLSEVRAALVPKDNQPKE